VGVRRIDPTNRRDVGRFIELPFCLYRDCPLWVPPMRGDMSGVFKPDFPLYKHSEAAFFLHERDDDVQGRIAVVDNRRYNEHHGKRTAFFYYFDCIDDATVSRALFEAGETWARARGLNEILGPKGLLRADGVGLLVEGFEHRPAMGVPYNHAYYARLIEDAGLTKAHDFVSGYLTADYQLAERYYRVAEAVKKRRGFTIIQFETKDELRAMVEGIKRIYNESFESVWGYYPVDDDEINAIADRLISIADPRLIKLVMRGDEIAGFLFAYPDLSDAMRRARGRLWPFGWLHFLGEAKRTDWVSINGMGLLPQYQGLGGNAILYTELVKSVGGFHFKHADMAQVSEENMKSLGEGNALGVEWYKWHRVYRKSI